ncbi:hypothetical protein [Brevibacillus fluminis]|uniref:hypothetical protein n=1 Tax=Brevibacillus fluminis TaxID=511487 RepID=UPI0016064A34|nr:hypothetical protein [Brevibacillus fluminis]
MNVLVLFLPGGLVSLLAAALNLQLSSCLFGLVSIIIGMIEFCAVIYFGKKGCRSS